TWLLLAIVALVFVLFVVHELHHPAPILDPRLLATRLFAVPATAITLLSATTIAGLVYIPLYVQGVLGHSATRGGLVLAPLMLSSISGRFVINWLRAHHRWLRVITLTCMGIVALGAAMLFLL